MNLLSVFLLSADLSVATTGFGGCWDVAAGSLIVEEAGGCVTDPSGGPFDVMARRCGVCCVGGAPKAVWGWVVGWVSERVQGKPEAPVCPLPSPNQRLAGCSPETRPSSVRSPSTQPARLPPLPSSHDAPPTYPTQGACCQRSRHCAGSSRRASGLSHEWCGAGGGERGYEKVDLLSSKITTSLVAVFRLWRHACYVGSHRGAAAAWHQTSA